MAPTITIDFNAPIPIYRQIADALQIVIYEVREDRLVGSHPVR
jgi:DNA-binding transcriptional regulator YhcF (GntR family)